MKTSIPSSICAPTPPSSSPLPPDCPSFLSLFLSFLSFYSLSTLHSSMIIHIKKLKIKSTTAFIFTLLSLSLYLYLYLYLSLSLSLSRILTDSRTHPYKQMITHLSTTSFSSFSVAPLQRHCRHVALLYNLHPSLLPSFLPSLFWAGSSR